MIEENKLHQITDIVHGTEFLSYLESELISTPIFYRLHDIYQSSTVYMTYPSNRTKRYEHSLGTMELAGKMLFSSLTSAEEKTLEIFFDVVNEKLTEIFLKLKNNCSSTTFNAIYLNDAAKSVLNMCLHKADRNLWTTIGSIVPGDDKYNVFSNMALDQFQYYPVYNEEEQLEDNQVFQHYFCYRVVLEAIRIVALFHDVGHPPYSHVIEEVLKDLYFEEECSDAKNEDFREILRPYVTQDKNEAYKVNTPYTSCSLYEAAPHERIGVHFLQVAFNDVFPKIITDSFMRKGNGIPRTVKTITLYYIFVAEFTIAIFSERDTFFKSLHKLVDGLVDADRLDYIQRDSVNSGVDWGSIPYDRLIMPMKLMRKKNDDRERFVFAFPAKVEEDISDLLCMRYKIFARINFHHRSMKSASALQTCVKLLARNYLEHDETEIINHDISILWSALNVGAGDLTTRIMQWNDSWLISTLQYALIELEDPDKVFDFADVELLRVNLKELLLNQKKYISVFKRGRDCKEFAKHVFENTEYTRNDFDAMLRKEKQELYQLTSESSEGLRSNERNIRESIRRIEYILKYIDTGDMKMLEQIMSNNPVEILYGVFDQMKEEGRIEDYRYIVNDGREKTGLPKKDGDYDEIYLYSGDKVNEMDTEFVLKPQIEAIRETIPWLFFYVRPKKGEQIIESVMQSMIKAIAQEIDDNLRSVFRQDTNCHGGTIMCYLPTGNQVITKRDLCNLINGVILRQTRPFVSSDIVKIVGDNLKGSPYAANNANLDIAERVRKYLDMYRIYDFLKLEKGKYNPTLIL